MHNEEDPKWGEYAAACIRNIWSDAGRDARIAAEVEQANREEPIFTAETGGEQILWEMGPDNALRPALGLTEGWRERYGGRRRVTLRGDWGWLTEEDFCEKQRL